MAASSSSRGLTLAFSTLGAPSDRRADLWRQHCSEHMPGYRCSPLGTDDLRISIRRTWIRDVEIVEVSGDGNLMERTTELITRSPDRTVMIGILTAGRAFVQHGDLIDVLGPGDAVIYDPSSPCSYGRSDGFEEVALVVPHQIFDRHGGDDGPVVPRIVRRDDSTGQETLQRSRLLLDAIHRRPVVEGDVTAAVEQVLDAIVGDGRPSVHWLAARDHIRRSLADPLLSVASVAAAVGVSERQLARVFADRGSTVRATIIGERMRRAYELVTDPRREAMTIAQIARAVGFVSPSHFARAFRHAHGVSATAIRRSTARSLV